MLIRMLVGISGPLYTLGPDDEFHFPNDEALRLIDAGFAVPVAENKVERAVQNEAPERRARKKRDVVSGNDNDGSD